MNENYMYTIYFERNIKSCNCFIKIFSNNFITFYFLDIRTDTVCVVQSHLSFHINGIICRFSHRAISSVMLDLYQFDSHLHRLSEASRRRSPVVHSISSNLFTFFPGCSVTAIKFSFCWSGACSARSPVARYVDLRLTRVTPRRSRS